MVLNIFQNQSCQSPSLLNLQPWFSTKMLYFFDCFIFATFQMWASCLSKKKQLKNILEIFICLFFLSILIMCIEKSHLTFFNLFFIE